MTPVVHIGFTKAASTYLQALFDAHPGIHYPERGETARTFCAAQIVYDKEAARKYVETQVELAGHRQLVLSHERLSGNPHSGYYDWAVIAHRLRDACPSAKVVIAIREQYAMIASTYKQYVLIGGTATLGEYLTPVTDLRIPRFDWRMLRYVDIIRLYRELFGADSVLAFPIEALREGALASLFSFIGVEPSVAPETPLNEGMPDGDVDRRRRANLFRRPPSSLHDTAPIAAPWAGPAVRLERNPNGPIRLLAQAIIKPSSFVDSNRELSRLLPFDLTRCGFVG